jgi:hypothetical protein
MKKLLLPIIFFLATNFLPAQHLYFSPASAIPVQDISGNNLQNAWAGGINYPLWSTIDINGDGIKDLYMFDKTNDRVSTFLNDGSAGIHAYHYAPQYIRRFPTVRADAWAMCYDYNCDGNEDFFTLDSAHSGIEVWRNDYTVQDGLHFTRVSIELMEDWSGPQPINIYATSIYLPAFSDIDNDGDMDIIGFNNPANGKFAYHKNLSMENHGDCNSLEFVFDDQCWGNFTLSLGSNTVSSYHNVPCITPAPFGSNGGIETTKRDDTITTVCVFDIDGDGAKELLIGDQANPTCLMVHNGGTPASAEIDTSDMLFPSYDVSVNIFSYVHHAYIDADNDGKRDLLASAGTLEDKQGVWFYKNTNTDASPVFSLQKNDFLQNEMVETGQAACPVFFDADADGLQDIIVAHGQYDAGAPGIVSRLSYYKNVGTSTVPSFKLITDDYASLSGLNLFFPIAATFGDLDGDNDKDMIIGDFTGNVHYFNNSAGAGNPANFQLAAPLYMGIDVGNNATPQLVDMDYDGLLDLVIGEQTATLNYYHNNGTSASASFPSIPTRDTLGNIVLTHVGAFSGYSVPFIFTNSGRHEMLTGNMHGDVYYYDNIDNNLNGTFNRIDTVASGEFGIRSIGFNIFISGGDINNDGYVDMMVGLYSGGVQIYYGSDVPIGINEIISNDQMYCYPNPANNQLTVGMQPALLTKGSAGLAKNPVSLNIYNLVGELVLNRSINTKENSREIILDVSQLPQGMYVISVSDGKNIARSKVMIQH